MTCLCMVSYPHPPEVKAHCKENQTHKNGIRIPNSVKEALDINILNSNNLWHNYIKKDIPNVNDAVVEHDCYVYELIGYQTISGHLIFDVRMG